MCVGGGGGLGAYVSARGDRGDSPFRQFYCGSSLLLCACFVLLNTGERRVPAQVTLCVLAHLCWW